MLPAISIRQAHLIKYRLEPVFGLLAACTMVFGYGGLVQLVGYCMVGGCAILVNRLKLSPFQRKDWVV